MIVAGMTATEVARHFGLQRSVIQRAIGGVRALHPVTNKLPPRKPERDTALVEARRNGGTLDEIGREHGISRERVRQILFRHSQKTGEKFVNQHWSRSANFAATVALRRETYPIWRCVDCGKETRKKPAAYMVKTERCRQCYIAYRRVMPDEEAWAAENLRRDGDSWRSIGLISGVSPNQVMLAVARLAKQEGRLNEVRDLYGKVAWMARYGITFDG